MWAFDGMSFCLGMSAGSLLTWFALGLLVVANRTPKDPCRPMKPKGPPTGPGAAYSDVDAVVSDMVCVKQGDVGHEAARARLRSLALLGKELV